MANGIMRQRQTKVELAKYLSGSCFGPAKSTLVRAIKNNHLTSWPDMAQELINKHLPTGATAKGHLNQESKKYNQQKLKSILLSTTSDLHRRTTTQKQMTLSATFLKRANLTPRVILTKLGNFRELQPNATNIFLSCLITIRTSYTWCRSKVGTHNTLHKLGWTRSRY